MNKKLNLLGVRKLRLVEAEQPKQEINIQWLTKQLEANEFQLEEKNNNLYIGYTKPILQLFFTYANDSGTVFNEIRIDNTDKFPLIKKQEAKLVGVELTTDNLKNEINKMIPTSQTMVEDVENLPTQSIQNINQWENVKKYMENKLHFIFEETDVKDDSGIVYNLTWKNSIATIYPNTIEWGFGKKKKKYNSLEELFTSVAKNLGIQDLTSQLLVDDEETEKEQETQTNTKFNKNSQYGKIAQGLRDGLSERVKSILKTINEDYDAKDINVWNLAYSKCGNADEQDRFIQYFLVEKMNIVPERVERNFLGLRQWADGRGFDIKKNLSLRYLDLYTKRFPDDSNEVPSGSLIVLEDLYNRKLISETDNSANFLFDEYSILYERGLYDSLNTNYGDVIDVIKMYQKVYNYGPQIMTEDKKEVIEKNYSALVPYLDNMQDFALHMCIANDGNLRDMDTIETIFAIVTGQTRRDIEDKKDKASSTLEDIIKDLEDGKIDSLEDTTDRRTLRLIADAINTANSKNPNIIPSIKNSAVEISKRQ